MRKYLNGSGIPLSVAVFLATDNYDHDPDTISATALLKPIRQIILAARVPAEDALVDIAGLADSRDGSAYHDGIENAWLTNYKQAMADLGYPQRVIDMVRVNPKPEDVTEDIIPVYLEQRLYRKFMGYTISGKFDFVAEGRVEDFKKTGTFTWIKGTKDEDYSLQGSIYRWLDPKLITDDHIQINFFFKDWMPGQAQSNPKYPPAKLTSKLIPLKSLNETEAFIRQKLTQYETYKDAPESELPYCSDEDLWRSPPKFKYYRNPANTGRSTKNFDTRQEAHARLAEDNFVGKVVEVPGEVKFCGRCPGFLVCTQKDAYLADGSLKL